LYRTIDLIYGIEINLITFLFNPSDIFKYVTKKFNEYSIEHALNITLNTHIFTSNNTTSLIENYGSSLEYLMNKKSDKYDIYMFDNIYLNQYGDDLMNLQERIPNNILNNFNNSITKSLCVKKGKLLCLV